MLLMCIEDVYTGTENSKIFTSGKAYRAIFDYYVSGLNEQEIEAFNILSEDHPHIRNMLNWGVIKATNDLGKLWIIEIIEDIESYNPSAQFKNDSFIQISTFNGGIYK